jgi:hypothetical protein
MKGCSIQFKRKRSTSCRRPEEGRMVVLTMQLAVRRLGTEIAQASIAVFSRCRLFRGMLLAVAR